MSENQESSAFEAWWNDQDNGCPTLVLNTDEQFARAVWKAASAESERYKAALEWIAGYPSQLFDKETAFRMRVKAEQALEPKEITPTTNQ